MTNLSMPRCDIEELKGQIEQLKAENQQLKELLKECRDFIYFCTAKCFGIDKEKMTTKIDNAIGENK